MSRDNVHPLYVEVFVIQGQDDWGVTYSSTEICALKGSTVEINCTYTYPSRIDGGDTEVKETFWFTKLSGNQPVDLSTDSDYQGRVEYSCYEKSCTLRITDLRESDSAEYKFRFITNQPAGRYTGSPGVTLRVTDLQVKVNKLSSSRSELKCHSSCRLPDRSSYIWYMSGEKIQSQTSSHSVYINYGDSYSCAVKGHEDFPSPPVYAPKLPSVSVSPSAEIVEGSSVTLTCSSDANPAAKYTWYKENGDPDLQPLSKEPQLVFSSIQSSDSGEYYCTAENELGRRTSEYISINMTYAPKLPSVSVSPSAEIVEGSSVTLTCSSDANPAANYTWYKENEDSPKASGQIFTITDFRAEHSGNYYCEAQNSRGRHNSTLQLIVVAGLIPGSVEAPPAPEFPIPADSPTDPSDHHSAAFSDTQADLPHAIVLVPSFQPPALLPCCLPPALFQREGAATEKAVSPQVRCLVLCGGVRKFASEERTVRDGLWPALEPVEFLEDGDDVVTGAGVGEKASSRVLDVLKEVMKAWIRVSAAEKESVDGQTCDRVIYTDRSICASKGSSVDISCTYSSFTIITSTFWFSPERSHQWQSPSQPEDLSEDSQFAGRVQVLETETGRSTLRITDLTESDSAQYHFKFIARRFEWRSSLPATTLTVTALQVQVTRTTVHQSDTEAELKCHSSCSPAGRLSYVWFKNGQKVTGVETSSFKGRVYPGDIISCALKGHENYGSPSVYALKLPSVSVSPSAEIVEGSSVTLTCSSDANPAAKYTWYKENGDPDLQPLSKEPQLVFSSIQSSDSGEYYCTAEKELGRKTSEYISIDVTHAPKLPSVSVSPSAEIVEGSSVNLTCSSDANPAANYTLYKENEDSPKASGQIFTITDFRAEHSGNYYCEAQNSRGRHNSTLQLIVVAGETLTG
ncbi:sialoadhesin-like [Pagrus major]|uniref:sialoadhesin-like n=1 Tax=Pagrus major TaxID=143350 RepID=UPI003CC8B025